MNEKQKDNQILTAFNECRDGIVRNLIKLFVQPQDVDDILQATFIRALEANRKQAVKSPKDYLFVISRNLVFRSMSAQNKMIRADIEEALMVDVEASSVDVELHYREKLQAFEGALNSLSENSRRAIVLRKYYGLSYKEIALKMGVSISSVEKYVALGIAKSKVILQAKGYFPQERSGGNPVKEDVARNMLLDKLED